MGFASAAASGFGLTLLAEAGDKTFFVSALLAAKGPKVLVFIGSYAALALQTVLCIALALLFTNQARSIENQRYRWDLIIGGAVLLGFGAMSIYEAFWSRNDFEDDQDMRNLDELIESMPKMLEEQILEGDTLFLSENALTTPPHTPADVLDHWHARHSTKREFINPDIYVETSTTDHTAHQALRRGSYGSCHMKQLKTLSEAASLIQDKSTKRLAWQAFGAVFAAELGDRSMFSTIALAATENPYGIAFGVLAGHFLVTIVAVSCASMICRYISQTTMTLFAGLLFCTFGVMSLFEAYRNYYAFPF